MIRQNSEKTSRVRSSNRRAIASVAESECWSKGTWPKKINVCKKENLTHFFYFRYAQITINTCDFNWVKIRPWVYEVYDIPFQTAAILDGRSERNESLLGLLVSQKKVPRMKGGGLYRAGVSIRVLKLINITHLGNCTCTIGGLITFGRKTIPGMKCPPTCRWKWFKSRQKWPTTESGSRVDNFSTL